MAKKLYVGNLRGHPKITSKIACDVPEASQAGRPPTLEVIFGWPLTYGVTDGDLQNLFAPHGTVQSSHVIMDRETQRSKGFGFVEMDTGEQAQAAIAALNGQEVNGRALTVNEARPREERGSSQRSGGDSGNGRRY